MRIVSLFFEGMKLQTLNPFLVKLLEVLSSLCARLSVVGRSVIIYYLSTCFKLVYVKDNIMP